MPRQRGTFISISAHDKYGLMQHICHNGCLPPWIDMMMTHIPGERVRFFQFQSFTANNKSKKPKCWERPHIWVMGEGLAPTCGMLFHCIFLATPSWICCALSGHSILLPFTPALNLSLWVISQCELATGLKSSFGQRNLTRRQLSGPSPVSSTRDIPENRSITRANLFGKINQCRIPSWFHQHQTSNVSLKPKKHQSVTLLTKWHFYLSRMFPYVCGFCSSCNCLVKVK